MTQQPVIALKREYFALTVLFPRCADTHLGSNPRRARGAGARWRQFIEIGLPGYQTGWEKRGADLEATKGIKRRWLNVSNWKLSARDIFVFRTREKQVLVFGS